MKKRVCALHPSFIVMMLLVSLLGTPLDAADATANSANATRAAVRPPAATAGHTSTNRNTPPQTPANAREWTIMVFMAGDNNLWESGDADINEMERVGSSDKVTMVVEFDRLGSGTREVAAANGGWRGARRFLIKKDTEPHRISSPVVGELGDIDMASEQAVVDFAKWARAAYPARRYALILWNHGTGWKEIMPSIMDASALGYGAAPNARRRSGNAGRQRYADDAFNPTFNPPSSFIPNIAYSINYDDTAGTAMNIPTLGQTLAKVKGVLGQPIDLLGFDACLMQMLEVAYECAPSARWQVGAAEREPETGWAYDAVLAALEKKPAMDPKELGEVIARTYHAAGASAEGGSNSTISLLDLAKISEITNRLNKLSDALAANIGELEAIDALRDQALKYYYKDYVDLGDFCQIAAKGSRDATVKAAADELYDVLTSKSANRFIDLNLHRGNIFKNSTGLSIYFPDRNGFKMFSKRYQMLNISKRERWYPFLDQYATPNVPYLQINQIELTDENRDGKFAPGEAVQARVVVENLGRKPASGFTLHFDTTSPMITPATIDQKVTEPSVAAGKKATLPEVKFTLSKDTPLDTEIPLNFKVSGAGPFVASYTLSFYVKAAFAANSQALLVITDAFSATAQTLQNLLRNANVKFDLWDRMLDGDIKPDVLARYAKGWVLFSVQNSSDQQKLTDGEIAALDTFLDKGGRLLLTGQDLGFGLRETPFLAKRCKSTFVQDDTNIHVVKGLAGFADNTVIDIHDGDGANNQKWPDEIDPGPGATPILGYVAEARDIDDESQMNGPDFKPGSKTRGIRSTGTAGVSVADNFRLVFLSFGLEGVSTEANRQLLLKHALAFLLPDLQTEIRNYSRASRAAARAPRTATAIETQSDLLANWSDRIVTRARQTLEQRPQDAGELEGAVTALQQDEVTGHSDLTRQLKSLLEFRRQHGN